MLFKVDLKKTILETNPDIETIEEFVDVPDRTLKYLFLVYDYETPYKKLPLEQRKEKVALKVGFKLEKGRNIFDKNARDVMNGNNKKANIALKAFKELIYDSDKETLKSIDDLMSNIREEIRTPGRNAADMKNKAALAKELTSLASTRKQLAQILEIQDISVEEEDEESSDNKVSTLELLNEGLLG